MCGRQPGHYTRFEVTSGLAVTREQRESFELVHACIGDYALLDMSEEEFSWHNRLYWWRPLLGPQSVNGIDGGRGTCGDYCGDGGAKSQVGAVYPRAPFRK